jgi:hypothetical protein
VENISYAFSECNWMFTLYISLHTEHQCNRTTFPPYTCPGSLSLQLSATIFYQLDPFPNV